MNNLFLFHNYIDFMNNLVLSREERGHRRGQLAKAMGCQATYFSQVLKGKAHLTEDHAIKLCEFLSFNDNETEYFMVLLRLGKAGTPSLHNYLEKRRQSLLEFQNEIINRIDVKKNTYPSELIEYYCSSWVPAVIHIATSCEDFQTPRAITERFQMDESDVQDHLQKLEKFELVKFENGKWIYSGSSLHFPKKSPLNMQLQVTRRLLAMNTLCFDRPKNLHYGVVFACDKKTFEKQVDIFLSSIENLVRTVHPTKSEDVYAFCLDLFQV